LAPLSRKPLGGQEAGVETKGLNHLGLAVARIEETTAFFTKCLGWVESGRDDSYPRTAVSDGVVRLTLWQVDHALQVNRFDRRKNIGLHHVAIEVSSEADLQQICASVRSYPGAQIEFEPELIGAGPRKHMMCREPGGIRIEFIWPAA
jgi:catechol 2,3-dioxygenase-like lactoylglutathione lyase family enzyme